MSNGFRQTLTRLPIVSKLAARPPVVPVLRLAGLIGGRSRLRAGLSLEAMAPLINRAFAVKSAAAVALVINSPGGAPAQSGLIYKRIRDLAEEKKRTVLAFAEDVAASGGYMLACAGDEIFVHETSIIGSIGVLSGGFGFPEALKKLGVERRLYTAGESKAMLDPFSPEKAEDVARLKELQSEIHGYFKTLVRARRGERLKEKEERLFSGDVWTGSEAVKVGLADGVGDVRAVLRARFGDKVRLKLIEQKRGLLPRPGGVLASRHGRLPEDWAGEVIAAVEERAAWSRFGL